MSCFFHCLVTWKVSTTVCIPSQRLEISPLMPNFVRLIRVDIRDYQEQFHPLPFVPIMPESILIKREMYFLFTLNCTVTLIYLHMCRIMSMNFHLVIHLFEHAFFNIGRMSHNLLKFILCHKFVKHTSVKIEPLGSPYQTA